MIDAGNQFKVVLRGYDPAQVDRRLSELGEAATEAQQQLEDLSVRMRHLEAERDRAEEQARTAARSVVQKPPTFTHLGERVGQILSLAEVEAEEIRGRVRMELEEERESLVEQAGLIRSEADRYATERRGEADAEAAGILEEARRSADERIDAAERDAAARLQEAEAVYEEQRARAAKAAADFETTLASRRKSAEQEFAEQMADTQRRLEESERLLEKARAEAEATTADATRDARRIVQEAEQQATHIVTEAKTTAARIRSDCQRELSAATQRRDSINAQLSNVRQMLATLTGGAATGVVADTLDDSPVHVGGVSEEGAIAAEDDWVEGSYTSEAEADHPVDDSADGASTDSPAADGAAEDDAAEDGPAVPVDGVADSAGQQADQDDIDFTELSGDDTILMPAIR
ncbi:MAG TPA: hypothetical protein VF165_05380 [Nocardioidaceae bacterium]